MCLQQHLEAETTIYSQLLECPGVMLDPEWGLCCWHISLINPEDNSGIIYTGTVFTRAQSVAPATHHHFSPSTALVWTVMYAVNYSFEIILVRLSQEDQRKN